MRAAIGTAAVVLALTAGSAQAAVDGARLFQFQCRACHAPSHSPVGPSLTGVVGAKVAGKAGFAYSAGLKAKGGTWTRDNLDAFLADSGKFAPGTRMMTRVAKPEDRAALIDYLATQK